jgi:hypothetical protein
VWSKERTIGVRRGSDGKDNSQFINQIGFCENDRGLSNGMASRFSLSGFCVGFSKLPRMDVGQCLAILLNYLVDLAAAQELAPKLAPLQLPSRPQSCSPPEWESARGVGVGRCLL